MQKPSDERLIAYLDGELADERARRDRVRSSSTMPELRERAARSSESAALLRARLRRGAARAAARAPDRRGARRDRCPGRSASRRGCGAASASAGAGGSAFRWRRRSPGCWSAAGSAISPPTRPASTATQQGDINLAAGNWLDNIAGYHKLFVNAGANDMALADVPANDGDARKVTQKLPSDFRLPNLKPWGLVFQGARFLIVEGRPATQLFYTTDNKALGPADRRGRQLDQARSRARPSTTATISTCSTGAITAMPTRSSAPPISAISGTSPTTSPGSSTRSEPGQALFAADARRRRRAAGARRCVTAARAPPAVWRDGSRVSGAANSAMRWRQPPHGGTGSAPSATTAIASIRRAPPAIIAAIAAASAHSPSG